MPRDNFSQTTKENLAKRAGYLCSVCRCATVGPNDREESSVNIGVAAHIAAASELGPRFDPAMTREDRVHISNGIWVCQNCAKEVDSDIHKYTIEVLRGLRESAERDAGRRLSGLHARWRIEDVEDPLILSFRLLENSEDWRSPTQEERSFYCLRNPAFTIRRGRTINQSFSESWLSCFPNQSASSEEVHLYWHETLLLQTTFISCDGGRFFLPIPVIEEGNSFSLERDSFAYRIARLFSQYFPLDATLNRCGIHLRGEE